MVRKHLFSVMALASVFVTYAQGQGKSWDNQVTQAAALIKGNPEAAEDAFETLLKGDNKKNVALLVDIGEAYLKEGDAETAQEYADRAKEVNRKCADAYVLSGDVAMARKDVNRASSEYNQAIYFDENCSEAYLKYADVYQWVNPQLSIEMLERLQKKTPDDARVDRQLGEIYYGMGEYGKAIEAYDEYMETSAPEIKDYTRYATLLYLNKEFDESLQSVNEGLKMDANNPVLKRLLMYDQYELGNYDAGLADAAAFFFDTDSAEWVYLDHVYYGRLLKQKQQYDDALVQFEKALALDKTQTHIYQDISSVYEAKRDYPQAINAFRTYMEAEQDAADMGQIFLYGRLNYYAATDSVWKDSQADYLAEADTAFARVMEYAPENYLGFFWRARTNSLKDPETTEGLAKPYYEVSLSILEQKPEISVSLVVECLSYLGYYYFVKEDYPKSKEFWTRILEIEPENETAKAALEGMK